VKSSVQFKSLNFLTKKSTDLNCDWNQWFKLHWFKSAKPGMMAYISSAYSHSFPARQQRGLRLWQHTQLFQWLNLGWCLQWRRAVWTVHL